tara:strand:- start:2529 stop:3170 length:642 start_codon:yes stop_codon:yes gene_type:complete
MKGGGQGNAKPSAKKLTTTRSTSSRPKSSQGERSVSPPINISGKKSLNYNQTPEGLLHEGLLRKGDAEDRLMMVEEQRFTDERKKFVDSVKKIQALQRGRKTRKRTDYLKRILDEEPRDQDGYHSDGEEYATEAGKFGIGITESRERNRRKSVGGGTKKKRKRKTRKRRKRRKRTKRKRRRSVRGGARSVRGGGNYTQRSPVPRQVMKAFRNR